MTDGPTPDNADRCSAPYRVRFDEAGADGLLRTSVLLRYAQDLAWHHSASRGFDRDWYAERRLTWLVRAAEVSLLEPIHSGDVLIGTTMVLGWRRVWARRRTEFANAAGRLVAHGQIDWVLLGPGGSPTRIPALFESVFGAPRETFALARVDPGDEPAEAVRTSFAVRPQELDPLAHVNNAVYLDWVEEAIAAVSGEDLAAVRRIPRTARLEYARAAEPGSTVDLVAWQDDVVDRGTWSVRIRDETGTELVRATLEG